MSRVDARLIEIDAVLIAIEADDLYALCGEGDGKRHTDIAEADQRNRILAGFDFFV